MTDLGLQAQASCRTPHRSETTTAAVTSVSVVGLPVTDLKSAKDFYCRGLGMVARIDEPISSQYPERRWIELVGADDLEGTPLVPYVAGHADDSVRILPIVLRVADLLALAATLSRHGASVEAQPYATTRGLYAHVRDPFGNLLTLHEPAGLAWRRRQYRSCG